jgi:hypothetical protein
MAAQKDTSSELNKSTKISLHCVVYIGCISIVCSVEKTVNLKMNNNSKPMKTFNEYRRGNKKKTQSRETGNIDQTRKKHNTNVNKTLALLQITP